MFLVRAPWTEWRWIWGLRGFGVGFVKEMVIRVSKVCFERAVACGAGIGGGGSLEF